MISVWKSHQTHSSISSILYQILVRYLTSLDDEREINRRKGKMGTCLSQPEWENDCDYDRIKNVAAHVFNKQNHQHYGRINSTPNGGRKKSSSVAYDLALISPSEKTAVTDVLSPLSNFPSSPPETTSPFTFVINNSTENEEFPSDEECEEPHSPMKSNIETVVSEENDNSRENYSDSNNDEDCDQIIHNDVHDRYNLQNSSSTNVVDEHRFDRKEMSDAVISECKSGSYDSIKCYQLNSKPDPPPLLAPPKDTKIVPQISNSDTTVKPVTIASFNKIKTELERAHQQEKQRRQEEKIIDRRRDIEGYKELWEDYNEIKKVIKTQERAMELQQKGLNGISLSNLRTWSVDFSQLSSTKPIIYDHKTTKDVLPLSTKSTIDPQIRPFQQQKGSQQQQKGSQQQHLDAHSNSVNLGDMIPLNDSDESIMNSRDTCDYDKIEMNREEKSSFKGDLDLEDLSIISDLDNGSTLSCNGIAFDNNDYGVLRRYRKKSIESTVPTHFDSFNEDMNVSSSTPKTLNENCKNTSFQLSLSKNCLPSVYIENAETGQIRWREISK